MSQKPTIKFKKYFLIYASLCFLCFNTINAQWIYPELSDLKTDVIITYDVIYDKELTAEQKKSSSFMKDKTIIFNNKGEVISKRFYNDIKINQYYILDYKNLKSYSCNISTSGSKKALVSNFKNPKKQVEVSPNETKKIIGFDCDKGTTRINGVSKDIYYTRNLGIRFCYTFNVDGFILEYPGYNKSLGHYKVVAKNIYYKKLDPSLFSLDDFKVYTKEEYDKLKGESAERYHNAKLEHLGTSAKKFNARTIFGKKISSKAMLGEVTVLNFWFTTCAPCKKEIPQLNKLKEKYKEQGVNFISVALDPDYKIASFLKKNKFNYDIVPEGRWLAHKYDVSVYPTNIVLDKKGVFQLFEVGYKSDIIERMSYKIDEALAE